MMRGLVKERNFKSQMVRSLRLGGVVVVLSYVSIQFQGRGHRERIYFAKIQGEGKMLFVEDKSGPGEGEKDDEVGQT